MFQQSFRVGAFICRKPDPARKTGAAKGKPAISSSVAHFVVQAEKSLCERYHQICSDKGPCCRLPFIYQTAAWNALRHQVSATNASAFTCSCGHRCPRGHWQRPVDFRAVQPSSSDIKTNTRRLRAAVGVEEGERRLVNVDLAIKDAVHKVRKETKWPLQFATWKAMNKTPQRLIREWGMKYPFSSHPKWKKLLAYQKVYGKGPLTYPKVQK